MHIKIIYKVRLCNRSQYHNISYIDNQLVQNTIIFISKLFLTKYINNFHKYIT
jgi:hypothetical protein